MRNKLAALTFCSLILLVLGAQPATWGQTTVNCPDNTFLANWSAPTTWGLEPPCYPDEGVCSEGTWFVTVQPLCFLGLDVSPSVATLFLMGGLSGSGPATCHVPERRRSPQAWRRYGELDQWRAQLSGND